MTQNSNPATSEVPGSATRHFLTGLVAAAIGGYAAKKGLPSLPTEVVSETSSWVMGVGAIVAAGVSSALGGLWRKYFA